MNRRLYLVAAAALTVIAGVSLYVATTVEPSDLRGTSDLHVIADSVPSVVAAKGWINSPPLSPRDLAGKVVLYDFWTYSCVNCVRTLPHLRALYDRYKDDGLVIVGVHSPEFDFEKDHESVQAAVTKLGVTWPVALDDDMAIWRSFENNYWPEEYLVDRDGRLQSVRFGEGDYDDKENDVRTLLGIPSSAPRAAPAGSDPSYNASITPELHFGLSFGAAGQCSSPEPLTKGLQDYSLPDPLPRNTFALSGPWAVTDQGISSAASDSTLVLRYRAGEVNIVVGSTAPMDVMVELDGQPLTTLHVEAHDLYNVVRGGPAGDHTLAFHAGGSGFEAFAFTFGA